MGCSSSGSKRASRAGMRASGRSFLLLLSLINLTFRAFATNRRRPYRRWRAAQDVILPHMLVLSRVYRVRFWERFRSPLEDRPSHRISESVVPAD